jgi:hypothetical protein
LLAQLERNLLLVLRRQAPERTLPSEAAAEIVRSKSHWLELLRHAHHFVGGRDAQPPSATRLRGRPHLLLRQFSQVGSVGVGHDELMDGSFSSIISKIPIRPIAASNAAFAAPLNEE